MDNAQVTSFVTALMAIQGWSELTRATFAWLLTDAMRARGVDQRLAQVGLCFIRTEDFGSQDEIGALGTASEEYPNAFRVTKSYTVQWLTSELRDLAPESRRAPAALPPRTSDTRATAMDRAVRRTLGQSR